MQIQLYFVLPIEEFCFAEIFVPFPKIPIKILQIIKNMFFGICGLIFKKSNFFIVFGLVKNWYLIFIPVYFSHSILLVLSFICIQVFWPILSLLQIYLSTYLSIYLSICISKHYVPSQPFWFDKTCLIWPWYNLCWYFYQICLQCWKFIDFLFNNLFIHFPLNFFYIFI